MHSLKQNQISICRKESSDRNAGPVIRRKSAIAVITGVLTLASLFTTSSATQVAPRRVEVTAKRYAFEPAEITLKKGQPVELVLTSADVPHGVRFRDLNLDIQANKSTKADVKFTPDKLGSFVGHCSVFCGSGHGHMALTIHVVE